MTRLVMLLGLPGIVIGATAADAEAGIRLSGPSDARGAAIHPVADAATMRAWLSRVPATRDFPPDFAATLRGQAPAFIIEMTTTPGCTPCADLWAKLQSLHHHYGLHLAVVGREEAMLRSGRFGLPWVGHPVAWARAADDQTRMVPVAIGTDHAANLARNIYLAFKMMTGVRAAVGVRAMAKYTGIVGVSAPLPQASRR
ncbi:hypothetical protein Q4F19_13750 [Sphingomonas sp. BIUV-7]|uniref:Uncharacterized protein n=1 Tax=Sphingomonas natans TaxID=3063330 RepID=A0ABT8YBS2_9SPHN|nr:hypothetical protein [Sphingomonas sp. BIUV-7]MDO6415452.1 hypothetical protein [Sphingomonas sp. BIUV-7]